MNNKPNSLPEKPDKLAAIVITCPSCAGYVSQTSPNPSYLLCEHCGTEFHDMESTRPAGLDKAMQPKKDTKPFKDGYDRG